MAFILKELVKNSTDIPSLPQIFYQIMDAVNDPDTTIDDIGKIISADISLTTRLLQLVNSSFYGLPDKVTSVPHALNIPVKIEPHPFSVPVALKKIRLFLPSLGGFVF